MLLSEESFIGLKLGKWVLERLQLARLMKHPSSGVTPTILLKPCWIQCSLPFILRTLKMVVFASRDFHWPQQGKAGLTHLNEFPPYPAVFVRAAGRCSHTVSTALIARGEKIEGFAQARG
jgi:hypothetical protein